MHNSSIQFFYTSLSSSQFRCTECRHFLYIIRLNWFIPSQKFPTQTFPIQNPFPQDLPIQSCSLQKFYVHSYPSREIPKHISPIQNYHIQALFILCSLIQNCHIQNCSIYDLPIQILCFLKTYEYSRRAYQDIPCLFRVPWISRDPRGPTKREKHK